MSSPVSMTYVLCHRPAILCWKYLILHAEQKVQCFISGSSAHYFHCTGLCVSSYLSKCAGYLNSSYLNWVYEWLVRSTLSLWKCMESFMTFCIFQFVPRYRKTQDFAFYLISTHKIRPQTDVADNIPIISLQHWTETPK